MNINEIPSKERLSDAAKTFLDLSKFLNRLSSEELIREENNIQKDNLLKEERNIHAEVRGVIEKIKKLEEIFYTDKICIELNLMSSSDRLPVYSELSILKRNGFIEQFEKKGKWKKIKDLKPDRVRNIRQPRDKERILNEEKMSDQFKDAYENFFSEVRAAKGMKWVDTSKEAALKCLDIIKSII